MWWLLDKIQSVRYETRCLCGAQGIASPGGRGRQVPALTLPVLHYPLSPLLEMEGLPVSYGRDLREALCAKSVLYRGSPPEGLKL